MGKQLRIALAGNANVGKSVIFNQLTGLNQIVGNWPGKTVERAEGTLHFEGYTIRIIDLPGIYSLSTFSMEEIVSRDYIATEKPDGIVNVVDASMLERNLYFTLQLLELDPPTILDLNQVDFAAKKGIRIDAEKLSSALGVPVIQTVAITGMGINELLSTVIAVANGEKQLKPLRVTYGKEIEKRAETIEKLVSVKLPQICAVYPARWIAIKLLERDEDVTGKIRNYEDGKEVLVYAEKLAGELEKIHGEPSPVIIASERYSLATKIAKAVTTVEAPPKISLEQKIDALTTHKILGYPILVGILAVMFTLIFVGGNFVSAGFDYAFGILTSQTANALSQFLPEIAVDLINKGVLSGVLAGISVALPYIVPFYILLALLEDSGYLPRAAFLMDNFMHKIGLHGKAFIPLMLGYGCNVPACIGCRIMETQRERLLSAFVVVLIPCAARTVVILGLVGRFVGLHAALALYIFDLILVFALGRIAFKVLPGEPVGLIMEMPPYKRPTIKNILIKTWSRTRDFVFIAFPIIIAGSLAIVALDITGFTTYIVNGASPLISGWLGLPVLAGIPLIFGILRKELTLILLAELVPLQSLTAVQMIVFALVAMIYIPCLATIAALKREFGWKKALIITLIDVGLALFLGGIAYRILSL
ncbi:MAG: ferrous iron transport protein B [Candidatus Bathyarchaeota archaeon]|jgi:ferrous iron transport protein B|nr:ferrous iron transport protein B [Candidatus Bathyarchaeota archaeon A05DMB-5]MDH7558350.1 ferrous iron transport protein B [Candidatus Bathyarchaeota archaeon]